MSTAAPGVLKRSNQYFIDPKNILVGNNPRIDFGDLSEIEGSILQNGFWKHKPLVVRRIEHETFQFELRGRGGRRLRAVLNLLEAGKEFPDMAEGIPVVIEDKSVSDLEALIQDLVDNQQKPLLPMEEAQAYKTLKDSGMTLKEICAKVNRKHVHVSEMLNLLEADEEVVEAVKTGKINKTTAKQIATKARGNKEKQKELVKKSQQGGKAGKRLVKEEVSKIKRRPTTTKEVAPAKLLTESQLRTRLAVVSNQLAKDLKALGLEFDDHKAMMRYLADSDERSAGYHLGVLIGLSAALGDNVKITL